MIVYHGSSIEVKNPNILVGRTDIDFGQGFYVTKDKRMAEKWAAGKTTSINNMYELNFDDLNVITLGLTQQWLDFIAYNRGYSDQSFDISDVDVIIGPTADDKMFNTISSYLEGDLSAEKAIKYLNIVGYSNQIVLKTERAIDNIAFIKSMEIKGLQKDLLRNQILYDRKVATQGLKELINMDKIKTNNRRLISDENSNEQDTDYER